MKTKESCFFKELFVSYVLYIDKGNFIDKIL